MGKNSLFHANIDLEISGKRIESKHFGNVNHQNSEEAKCNEPMIDSFEGRKRISKICPFDEENNDCESNDGS